LEEGCDEMAESSTPGKIKLQVPRERLTADFKAIARHLAEAAAQGATLQIGNMISAIFNAGDQITWEDATGNSGLAWDLLGAGYAMRSSTSPARYQVLP
jgi:hypothetical protein